MIDLHVHSTMSDGTFSPTQLAELAKKTPLEAFALTDHDTICGTDEARTAALKYGVEFINGMEMSLDYDNHQIHVVALGFDADSPAFKELYTAIRRTKEESIANVIGYMAGKGVDISTEKVQPYVRGTGMDRYAILRYLVNNKSAVGDIQYLWDNYIDPAFKNLGLNKNVAAEQAFAAIKEAGGVTSLAHFHKRIGFLGCSRQEQEQHISYLHQMGMNGMEKYYPSYTEDDKAFAAYMIDKYDMMPTGGTDFHGLNRPSVSLGTGTNNNMNVPYEFYLNICRIIGR